MRALRLAARLTLLLLTLSAVALYLAGLVIDKVQHTPTDGLELAGLFGTIAYAGWTAANLILTIKDTE